MKILEVAVAFEPGWSVRDWIVQVVLVLGALFLVWCLPAIMRALADNVWVALLVSAASMALAVLILFSIPAKIFRHIENPLFVWISVFAVAVFSVILIVRGPILGQVNLGIDRLGALTAISGVGLGAAVDAFTRVAASIPVSVSTLTTLFVIGIVVAAVWVWRSERV